MPRNASVQVQFSKKRGFRILHTSHIIYMWEIQQQNKCIFIGPTNFTTLKTHKKIFFHIYIKIYCFIGHVRVCQNSYRLTPWIYDSPDGSSIVAGNIRENRAGASLTHSACWFHFRGEKSYIRSRLCPSCKINTNLLIYGQ